jgi:sulfur relay protein TusB/DsrH
VLSKAGASFYVLSDDLEIRGFTSAQVHSKVKVIGYGDIADLIMNDYEKTAWL